MTLQILVEQIRHMAPTVLWSLFICATWALVAFIAYSAGWKRGVNDGPGKRQEAWREEHFKRLVAEERAEAAERASAHFRVVAELAVSLGREETEPLQLVARRKP